MWAFHKFLNAQYFPIEDIPTNMTIVEVSDWNSEVILYNANETLKSRSFAHVSLTKPILIKPDFTYEIRLIQTLPENCCTSILMKSKVEPESGIVIQFHRDPVLEIDPAVARGLIYTLYF